MFRAPNERCNPPSWAGLGVRPSTCSDRPEELGCPGTSPEHDEFVGRAAPDHAALQSGGCWCVALVWHSCCVARAILLETSLSRMAVKPRRAPAEIHVHASPVHRRPGSFTRRDPGAP